MEFDLRVGDLIKECAVLGENGVTESKSKKVQAKQMNCVYRIDSISDWVILATRVKKVPFSDRWTPLYRESFMKLDYLQGLIVKKED